MSDDPGTPDAPWNGSNSGVTLPNATNATHDIGLSPIFINRTGVAFPLTETNGRNKSTTGRGIEVYTISNAKISLYVGSSTILPDRSTSGISGQPLRCLVSTNNR